MAEIVIAVAHESTHVLPGLLQSLRKHEPDWRVLVVDDASPSGPPGVDETTEMVVAEGNAGYGSAANLGVAHLTDESWSYVAVVNPDVRLRDRSLSQLASVMHGRPEVGIATGPVVDGQGTRVPSAWGPTSPARAFWFATGWQLPRLRRWAGRLRGRGAMTSAATLTADDLPVDGHVLGGAMVVRRECWEQLGGFDEDFFLYWEDADLCQRARDAGWEVRVLPCTPIVHEAGTSSEGVADEQRWDWYVEGADRFARKHLTDAQRQRLMAALRWGRKLRRR